MAHSALQSISGQLAGKPRFNARARLLDPYPKIPFAALPSEPAARLRLLGRYGQDAFALAFTAQAGDWECLEKSPATWAELRWAAHAEGVIHLDDLLLRRVRLGLILPHGGLPWLDRMRAILQPELGWSDIRWEQEVSDYAKLWRASYSLLPIF